MLRQRQRHNFALMLWEVGSVLTRDSDHPLVVERDGPRGKERGFKLELHRKDPNAPLSPLYLHLRTSDSPKPGPFTPDAVKMAALQMHAVLEEVRFEAVAGVPRAGTSFARSLAKLRGVEHISMEKGPEPEFEVSLTSFISPAYTEVLVVDDVISRAGSKRKPIELLRRNMLDVRHVAVLIDREQGGRQQLLNMGCLLHAAFAVSELLDIYVGAGKLALELRDEIKKYLVAN